MDEPEEPFDELMGPRPPGKKSPPFTRSASSLSSGAAPPSNAFVHTQSSDRWAQYERDGDQLQRDSAQANANAVLAAAERAADREPLAMPTSRYYDDPATAASANTVQARLDSAGASLDPPEPRDTVRRANRSSGRFSTMMGKSSQAISSSRYDEETIHYDDPRAHQRVRAEAIKVLEMAGGSDGAAAHRTATADGRNARRRRPAALSGLDLSAAHNRPSSASSRYTIDDDQDDDDMVDIINMENRVTAQGSTSTAMGGYRDDTDSLVDASSRSSTWSSRYSMDSHLRALNGMASSDMLARMEQEQDLNHVSARNMFTTSPHERIRTPTKIFGSGFTFKKKHVFDPASPPSDFNLQSHKTVWTDGAGTDWTPDSGMAPHLPTDMPSPSHHWQEGLARKRRYRRRACLVALLALVAIVIVASVVGTKAGDDAAPARTFDEGSITIYVTSNVPFDAEEETKLNLDLVALPDSGEFVVHLGNIQDAAVTMCPPTIYHDVSVVLRTSNLPVFMVPGADDWNNCPNPSRALTRWKQEFVPFERHWKRNSFIVNRMVGQDENWSVVRKGVLFVGVHLVDGRIDDADAWATRHARNARWFEEQLSLFDINSYRAVVLFGHARPSHQQSDFFTEVIKTLNQMGKPALYVHASSSGSSEFSVYKPFSNANGFIAVETTEGGKTRPMLINVGFGKDTFNIGEQQ